MPKAKVFGSLSGMIDSDLEDSIEIDDTQMQPSPDSNQENLNTKKIRGRPKGVVKKPTKANPPARRVSGGKKRKILTQPKGGRKKRTPLKEQQNVGAVSDIEEVEDFAENGQDETRQENVASGDELEERQPAKRAKQAPKAKKSVPKARANAVKPSENDGGFEYTPTTTRPRKPAVKAAPVNAPAVNERRASVEASRQVIPDTQDQEPTYDQLEVAGEDELDEDALPQSVYRQTNQARAGSRQPTVARRRAASGSDTERSHGDPATRRKLGEMTKKFENMDLKYRNLHELGIKEAQTNFERLKKHAEDKSKAATELIASLKSEIAAQKALLQDNHTVQKQLSAKDEDIAQAQKEASQANAMVAQLQQENRNLQSRLTNSRNASTAVESLKSRTPGSAIKGKGKAGMVGSVEAAHTAQVAQLKEDLYSDLSGLIIRGVDRNNDADIYDCIQTGRNGTLHFKLAVLNEADGKTSYEDTEFQYTPCLDSNRDRDLLELLPDYLSEEITFSRMNAAMFYSRVVDTLTRKRVQE